MMGFPFDWFKALQKEKSIKTSTPNQPTPQEDLQPESLQEEQLPQDKQRSPLIASCTSQDVPKIKAYGCIINATSQGKYAQTFYQVEIKDKKTSFYIRRNEETLIREMHKNREPIEEILTAIGTDKALKLKEILK
jgi:hypothetical protein